MRPPLFEESGAAVTISLLAITVPVLVVGILVLTGIFLFRRKHKQLVRV